MYAIMNREHEFLMWGDKRTFALPFGHKAIRTFKTLSDATQSLLHCDETVSIVRISLLVIEDVEVMAARLQQKVLNTADVDAAERLYGFVTSKKPRMWKKRNG